MKAFYFASRALWHRRTTGLFIALVWALGLLGIAATGRMERSLEGQLTQTLEGTDLLLTAKGSPTQAILANLFHIDEPTGNIGREEAEKWLTHPDLAHIRRLAYGDNLHGQRILGCDSATWTHIPIRTLQGNWPSAPMEVAISEAIAQKEGLHIGATFHGGHGTVEDLGNHDDHDYKVVGIFSSRTPLWNTLILTTIQSVWTVHEDDQDAYTAVLARIKNPMTRLMMPGQIQRNSTFMAVSPAMEANRMMGWLNQGGQVIRAMSWLLTLIAALSLVLLLQSHIRERLADYALVRAMGGSWGQIAGLVLWQNILLALAAITLTYLGLLVDFYLQSYWLPEGIWLNETVWWDLKFDLPWLLLHLFLAVFAGIGPWIWLQKIPLHRALVDS